MMTRKAKIVCTIGPASSKPHIISNLIKYGMDVARLNFSHGDHNFHREIIRIIRQESLRYGKTVSILQDLQGIKIRVGMVKDGSVDLKKGAEVLISSGDGITDEKNIYISYPTLVKDAKKGDRILLDDGLIQLIVSGKKKNVLTAKVIEGGILKDRKGVNLPGMRISLKTFTEKDVRDTEFGISMNVDYIAISFVRTASDVRKVKDFLRQHGQEIPVIAKIEKPEAVDDIESILDETDGIMIARGDLGVEVSPEKVPIIQKDLINRANRKGRFVITATQMLESMKEHLRPTRAEANDVSNAVIDGTDALMLSAETAAGLYPVESLRMMDRIISFTERSVKVSSGYISGNTDADALADSACRAAADIRAKVLVAFTRSGFTARLVSKFRPNIPVIAFTTDQRILQQFPLYWGVIPRYMKPLSSIDHMILEVEKSLIKENLVKKNDRIVIIASSPLSTASKTNFMKIHMIGG